MNLNDLDVELAKLLPCVEFDSSEDRSWSLSPAMTDYAEASFIAAKSLFIDPEEVLCRIFLSKVISDIMFETAMAEAISGKSFDVSHVLYWRAKPEIRDRGVGLVHFYARYSVVAVLSNGSVDA